MYVKCILYLIKNTIFRKSKIVNFSSTTFKYNANNIACNFTKFLTKIVISKQNFVKFRTTVRGN